MDVLELRATDGKIKERKRTTANTGNHTEKPADELSIETEHSEQLCV